MIKRLPISALGSVVTLTDSTEIGSNLIKAQNLIPRPLKAFSAPPLLRHLWELTTNGTLYSVLTAVARPGGGYLSSSDNTVAVRVYQHGKSVLVLFDMYNRKLRGLFYMGDDGSYTGEVSFTQGANGNLPYFEALAVGLDRTSRWYGQLSFGQLMIQNSVDDAVAAQLMRTAEKPPGRWRKRGSNSRLAAPVISLINPESSTNVQASRSVGGLTVTANEDNYPGASGNLKIKITITPSAYGTLGSTLTGDGVEGNPYIYNVTCSTANTNAQVAAFINADTDAVTIMTASVTSAGTVSSWSEDFLSGGSGSGQSTGLSNEVTDVVLRLFDVGHENCGYEGPSSEYSNELVIPDSAFKDILVRCIIDPTIDDGRFAYAGCGIRIYKRFGDVNPTYNLVTDTPISNSYRQANVVYDAAGDRLWTYAHSAALQMTSGNPEITIHPSSLLVMGNAVIFTSAVNGFAAYTPYYVAYKSGHQIKLSSSSTGTPLITPSGTSSPTGYELSQHSLTNNDTIKLTAAVANLTAGQEYSVVQSTSFNFKVSASRGGTAINITATGNLTGEAKVYAVYYVIGSQIDAGDLMSIDQNRPPAHRYVAMAGNVNWCAGVTGNEARVYSSKEQAFDEVCPEGVNLDDYDTVAKSSGSSSSQVSGLYSDKQSLHVHFRDGIVIIDPGDTNIQHEPPIDFGMINGSCITNGRGNKILFLAEDRNIYEFNGARYGTRAGQSITNNAIDYIRNYVSLDAMEQSPHKCNLLHDKTTQMIFVWMPTETGTIGFAFDENTQGIYGPYLAPCAPTHVCSLEAGRGVYVLGDDDGNLFVWDTSDQGHSSNNHTGQTALTYHATNTTPGNDHAGYLTNEVSVDGIAKDLWFSNETIFETSFLDAQSIGGRLEGPITFKGLEWRSVKGSRAFVEVTFTAHDGRTQTIVYGDMGAKERDTPHRVGISMRTNAISVKMRICSADLQRWTIRDLNLLYE
jgi:hypothetical protein